MIAQFDIVQLEPDINELDRRDFVPHWNRLGIVQEVRGNYAVVFFGDVTQTGIPLNLLNNRWALDLREVWLANEADKTTAKIAVIDNVLKTALRYLNSNSIIDAKDIIIAAQNRLEYLDKGIE